MCQGSHKAKRRDQEKESFVLRTYIVDGMGIKKLHFDWWVKVVPAFWGRRNYLKVGMGGDLLA